MGWKTGGIGGEIVAVVAEEMAHRLAAPVRRVAIPDLPAPASRALEAAYYPTADDIVEAALSVVGTA